MKSVTFWLLANLIKHVDEAFRGAAGPQERTEPESCDRVDLGRGHTWAFRPSSPSARRNSGFCWCEGVEIRSKVRGRETHLVSLLLLLPDEY